MSASNSERHDSTGRGTSPCVAQALLLAAALALAAAPSPARVLRVGPGAELAVPSAAAAVARDGDVVEIAAGRYAGDVAIWRANGLTIRSVGGMAHLDATGTDLPQRKAIWVIQGDDTRVEGIEFSNAQSPDRNGAGIRQEGRNLTVSRCFFHDNQEGILAGANADSDILVEYSEFARNGHADGQAHNIYIGRVRRFELRFSYFHHAVTGSNVKSRALENRILYNRIMDEVVGEGNYSIDLSNGGRAYVVGNLIQQGRLTNNYHLIAFAPEGASNPDQRLYVVNNTLVNDRSDGVFVMNRGPAPAQVVNNILVGAGTVVTGPAVLAGNLRVERRRPMQETLETLLDPEDTLGGLAGSVGNRRAEDAGLRDRVRFDYCLTAASPAIDAGVPPPTDAGFDLWPRFHYLHPAGGEPRPVLGPLDAGAYEWSAGGACGGVDGVGSSQP